MTASVLPGVALAALRTTTGDGRLVARPRGRVLHLAEPRPRDLTPAGALRRGRRPLCSRPAPAWPAARVDGRPLCARCAAALDRRGVRVPERADEQLVVEALRTARDLPGLDLAVLALCTAGLAGRLVEVDGQRVRAAALAAEARGRIRMAEQREAWRAAAAA